jgi:3-deoxy-D-manno-octulosonic acid kinase
VVFLRGDDGDWALRHYRRGGLPARLIEDRFLWLGEDRSRSFREWRLLRRLHDAGLPVPRPVAARYVRRGARYSADLITARIADAEPLSARLAHGPLPPTVWRRLGRCVRAFHDAGVFHADLNAHNLLLDGAGTPWLLDFDRGRLRAPGPWRQRNLDRFLRSLEKIRAQRPGLHAGAEDWAALLEGYGRARER